MAWHAYRNLGKDAASLEAWEYLTQHHPNHQNPANKSKGKWVLVGEKCEENMGRY